ncbi:rifampicin phosphotransferase [Parasteatoda tepidariorum]|uniref:rifampicin phosphotransferase n=1 Tax=Parasteatoda tepidariorum TaxID=114398 RepID=UPI001C724E65|nr:prodigiosin synthesizing transferase PigC [Parasteatoda tepidariorum]
MLIATIVSILSFPFEFIYWIKWIIVYVTVRIHTAKHRRRFDLYDPTSDDPEKLGILVPQVETDLESPQSEKHLQVSADEVLFYGINSKAECVLVRITRGCNQEAEAWIYLKLADGTTYHLVEHVNYQQPFEEKCLVFSCGNLQMHYLSPMRRWRIQYCGSLIKKSEKKEFPDEKAFVNFAFLWYASSDVYDPTLTTNPKGFASAIANSEWEFPFHPPVQKFVESMNFYCQMGNLRGTISVNEEPDYEINLFGEKIRNLGDISHTAGCQFENLIGYVPENGYGFHLLKASVPKIFKNMSAGFLIDPLGDISVIKEIDVKTSSQVTPLQPIEARFSTGAPYKLDGSMSDVPIVLYSGQRQSIFIKLFFIKFSFQNSTGYGLFLSGEVSNEITKAKIPMLHALCPKEVPLVVKFTDEIAQFGDISGGKGSSLGKLTKLSRKDKSFIVPKGIIVTTSAYEEFLTPDILNGVKKLENVAYGKIEGDIKQECEVVSKCILSTELESKICLRIADNLKRVFGDEFKSYKYAVRSSATGEDTDVMSAAGQMDTYLGVQGLKEIFYAVKKCWASQFGHIAVEYKRQNGQILNSPMAVVIQEMVACEVAGVIFTCDPVNNNPDIITITANYGLGETVVSGSVEPDTIMLERFDNNELKIKSVNVGSKHQKIVLKESGGTEVEDLLDDSKSGACINEEKAIYLGKLAIRVEQFYHSSRDIEWGLLNNKIYLLQSRPVTSGGSLTEFELKHEFDCILRSERDYFTVANVGEVMPGATSPLGVELLCKYYMVAYIKQGLIDEQAAAWAKSFYYPIILQQFYNQIVMPVPELIARYGHDTLFSKGFSISMFGRILDDPDLIEVTKLKVPDAPKTTIRSTLKFVKDLFYYNAAAENTRKQVENYDFPYLKCKTAQETFDALLKSFSSFLVYPIHLETCTENSSHWNTMVLSILYKAQGQFDNDVYSDFGRILATTTQVESADIPSSIQKVARQIEKDLGAEKFKAMSLQDAEKWLNTSNTLASELYRQFIQRHGHRCLKEFDIYTIPWGQDQKLFIKILQTLSSFAKEEIKNSVDDYSKIFSELRVPLNILNRLCLRFIIPNCRKGVQAREASKSVIIKSIDNWRKGYQYLGKLMVSEGRIPDKDLLFFMTMDEIRELLKTRYPKIIARANQRRKIFPVLDAYKFPEIIRGFPKPVNEEDESSDTTEYIADLTMQGIPVSQGVVKGYARVAVSLDEAAHLQPGEILIAYGTDIGWSPYFPIISGVVTELGGLISHGAVVSREYGLPCIVGLHGATKQFKTGDYVLLDGKKGILKRLPRPQE